MSSSVFKDLLLPTGAPTSMDTIRVSSSPQLISRSGDRNISIVTLQLVAASCDGPIQIHKNQLRGRHVTGSDKSLVIAPQMTSPDYDSHEDLTTSGTSQNVSQRHHSLTSIHANNLLDTHDLNTRLRGGNSSASDMYEVEHLWSLNFEVMSLSIYDAIYELMIFKYL
ncbi:hypothetical protein F2Q70_00037901 [Brassica cretica]|uniref:Uncharacterized protein n=1 Tax=Brassica cretica TaxID=69181 RepID=A0A8S9K3G5_BRACR|nr:hypothetical protein F2Q70_00037901 [Brassica cretica]